MARQEFTRKTKQAALLRAGHKCEAAGERYGFEAGQRCCCSLSLGVQFDHILPCEFGGENTIENCAAICVQCHKFATRNDIRNIRKSDRMRDKQTGVVRPASKLSGPAFPKTAKADKRAAKPPLPHRPMYQENQP